MRRHLPTDELWLGVPAGTVVPACCSISARWHRGVVRVVMLMLTVFALSACASSPDAAPVDVTAAATRAEGAQLFVFVRDGGPVGDDRELNAYMRGDAVPSEPVIAAASCQNVSDWLRDVSLSDWVLLSSNARFARLGDMITSGEITADQAVANEMTLLSDSTRIDQDGDLKRYYEATLRPPTFSGASRYALVARNLTLTRQQIFLFDIDHYRANDDAPRVVITRIAGHSEHVVDTARCDNEIGSSAT